MTNFNFSDIIEWDALSEAERTDILRRPAVMAGDKITAVVSGILDEVESRGDAALRDFSAKFDRTEVKNFKVSKAEVDAAISRLSPEFIKALQTAAKNIEKFHSAEVLETVTVETMPGVVCQQVTRPIGAVGLYIPGGTAPLFSTVLMLGIPAKIAGVEEIVLVTPPERDGSISPAALAAARIAGADRIFKLGGAQAVAALAYGTESVPRVDKIVGPGGIYVATAKRKVFGRVAIDMVAGPSEILVLADGGCRPDFVAADLLSQAEHDVFSSAVLVTDSLPLAQAVQREVEVQLERLPRREIARRSVEENGKILLTRSLDAAVDAANRIAPEHLELCVEDPFALLPRIRNAGSIFLGRSAPEALGDYFAGPNHTLPTSGTARFSSPLGVDDFIKRSSFLYYSQDVLAEAAPRIAEFARREGLEGHARSVLIRCESETKEM